VILVCRFQELVKHLEIMERKNGDEINADGMEMDEKESLVSHFDGVDPSMIERLHVC